MKTDEAALQLWQNASLTQGTQPSAARISRIRGKLSDPRSFLVLLEQDDQPVGLGLSEPYRTADGFGSVQPGHGHVSMVFVHPERRGLGIGTELIQRLIDEAPWTHLSLWTQDHLNCAERLRRLGFRATRDRRMSVGGVRAQRWEHARA